MTSIFLLIYSILRAVHSIICKSSNSYYSEIPIHLNLNVCLPDVIATRAAFLKAVEEKQTAEEV